MVVCDGEHFLQSLISMGIAVEMNWKSQCYMWPCVSVASAISCDSLKIAPPVLFLFLAIVFQRFSNLSFDGQFGSKLSSPKCMHVFVMLAVLPMSAQHGCASVWVCGREV